jgi:hsp70-interacting protein
MSSNGGGGGEPWAWLGLLKWSLQYSDGTRPSDLTPMSVEDRAFLERVMKDGIIDENERMKDILKQVTEQLEVWKTNPSASDEKNTDVLLQECRDIVEQIDYARAFMALKGLPFLLGCIQEGNVPLDTRKACLGILSTMAQHNPPVQKELLELGALKIYSDLYFSIEDNEFRAKMVQAISACVRSHELAENVFCQLEQSVPLLMHALESKFESLRQRALFLSNALVTADGSTVKRVATFRACIVYAVDYFLVEATPQLTETTLQMLEQLLERNLFKSVVDVPRREKFAAVGVERIAALRLLTRDELEFSSVELELWERVLILLAQPQQRFEGEPVEIEPILLLTDN